MLKDSSGRHSSQIARHNGTFQRSWQPRSVPVTKRKWNLIWRCARLTRSRHEIKFGSISTFYKPEILQIYASKFHLKLNGTLEDVHIKCNHQYYNYVSHSFLNLCGQLVSCLCKAKSYANEANGTDLSTDSLTWETGSILLFTFDVHIDLVKIRNCS